jgi:hypothetical protein
VEKLHVMAFKNCSGRDIGVAFESCNFISNSSCKLVISDYIRTILEIRKKSTTTLQDG